MNRQEILEAKCPECGSEPPAWHLKDESQDWGPLGVGPRWKCDRCDAHRVIVPYDEAAESDEFERFIKRWRDEFDPDELGGVPARWHTLDAMLDDYRERRATGTALNEESDGA